LVYNGETVDRDELSRLVQQLKERQEKVRDNTSLGDNGPR
jgi:hypothetical protein